jgi:hypothetical protein
MNRREKSDNINGWLGYFSAYGVKPWVKPGHDEFGEAIISALGFTPLARPPWLQDSHAASGWSYSAAVPSSAPGARTAGR